MRSAGFFKKNPGVVAYLKNDTDMQPLKEQVNFQVLLGELQREAGASGK
jgi:hypothetical protein